MQRTDELFSAIQKKEDVSVIEKLLESKEINLAAVIKINNRDYTPIESAVALEQIAIAIAISKSQKTNPTDTFRYGSALVIAVKLNEIDLIKSLLEADAPQTWYRSDTEYRCLHYAVLNNKPEILKLLLKSKPNLHAKDKNKFTPLNLACGLSRWDCVKIFLKDKEFKFENKKKAGISYIHAIASGEIEIAGDLIAAGASTTESLENGNTALHRAIQEWDRLKNNNKKTIDFVLAHNGNKFSVNKKNLTPIELASELGLWNCVSYLLGLEKNKLSEKECDDMHLDNVLINAIKKGDHYVTSLLLNLGVSCNKESGKGNVALYWAVKSNHSHIVKLLLEKGADPSFHNAKRDDTLAYAEKIAKKYPQENCVKVLKKYYSYHSNKNFVAVNELLITLGASDSLAKHRKKLAEHPEKYQIESDAFYLEIIERKIPRKKLVRAINHVIFCDRTTANLTLKKIQNDTEKNKLENLINAVFTHTTQPIILFNQIADSPEANLIFRCLQRIKTCYLYVDNLKNQLQLIRNEINKRCEEKTWLVRGWQKFNPFAEEKDTWTYGVPNHINKMFTFLNELTENSSRGKTLEIYWQVMKLFHTAAHPDRHPSTISFDDTMKKDIYSLGFLDCQSPLFTYAASLPDPRSELNSVDEPPSYEQSQSKLQSQLQSQSHLQKENSSSNSTTIFELPETPDWLTQTTDLLSTSNANANENLASANASSTNSNSNNKINAVLLLNPQRRLYPILEPVEPVEPIKSVEPVENIPTAHRPLLKLTEDNDVAADINNIGNSDIVDLNNVNNSNIANSNNDNNVDTTITDTNYANRFPDAPTDTLPTVYSSPSAGRATVFNAPQQQPKKSEEEKQVRKLVHG